MDAGSELITPLLILIFFWGFTLFMAYEAGKEQGNLWSSMRKSDEFTASDLLDDDDD